MELTWIKSPKAIRPYEFKVTVPPCGGTPNFFEGVVAEGRRSSSRIGALFLCHRRSKTNGPPLPKCREGDLF
jgi:hypothetical protein